MDPCPAKPLTSQSANPGKCRKLSQHQEQLLTFQRQDAGLEPELSCKGQHAPIFRKIYLLALSLPLQQAKRSSHFFDVLTIQIDRQLVLQPFIG